MRYQNEDDHQQSINEICCHVGRSFIHLLGPELAFILSHH